MTEKIFKLKVIEKENIIIVMTNRRILTGLILFLTLFIDVAQTKEYRLLRIYKTIAIHISMTPDGSYIAAGRINGNGIILINNKIGNLLWEYKAKWINSVSITPDGSYIVAGSSEGKIYLLDRRGNLRWEYKTGDEVNSVSITPDGSYIVAGSSDWKVYLFEKNGSLLWEYKTGGKVDSVSITSDGSYIVASSRDSKIYLFNKRGNLLWKYKITGVILIGNNSVSITPDGSYIVAGGDLGHIYFFNKKGELLWHRIIVSGGFGGFFSREFPREIVSISMTPDGSYIAVGSGDTIFLLNRDGDLLWRYVTIGPIKSVSITPDGSYVVAGNIRYSDNEGFFGYVYLFDKNGKLLWKYKKPGGAFSVSITSKGFYIASSGDDIRLFILYPSDNIRRNNINNKH